MSETPTIIRACADRLVDRGVVPTICKISREALLGISDVYMIGSKPQVFFTVFDSILMVAVGCNKAISIDLLTDNVEHKLDQYIELVMPECKFSSDKLDEFEFFLTANKRLYANK